MNGAEFYKQLQPAYAKWLESMGKADAVNNAAEIAFVKEAMFLLDELVDDIHVEDGMDPAWFLDACVETQHVFENWYEMFNGTEYFRDLIQDMNNNWKQYKKEHGRKFDDEENH